MTKLNNGIVLIQARCEKISLILCQALVRENYNHSYFHSCNFPGFNRTIA